MKPEDVKKVAVVGCGVMGSGIVEVVARSGSEVVYLEANDDLVARGRAAIDRSTAKALERGKITDDERDAALSRISGTTDVGGLADADLVIEAATEDPDAKRDIFRRLDRVTRPEVVLASNTSSIPIAELAAATDRPDKVVGMHFFNPPPVMRLLELTPAVTTSEETLAFARAYGSERLGKTVVQAKDQAGFIVNRLLAPYLNGAIKMLEDGFATREDIDTAIALGLGHPMGPLTLCDLVGLDVALYVADVLYAEFRDPMYAPPPLLRRMVTAGMLGRKTGKGFYEYEV